MAPRSAPEEDDDSPGPQGHYLREWLEFLDVKQVDLEKRLNTEKSIVSRMVNAGRRLPTYELRKVAAALGLKPEALLYAPTDMSPEARAARMSKDALAGMIRRELGD